MTTEYGTEHLPEEKAAFLRLDQMLARSRPDSRLPGSTWLREARPRLRLGTAGSGSLVFVDDADRRAVLVPVTGGVRRNYSSANQAVYDAMYRIEVPELGFVASDHMPRLHADTPFWLITDYVPDAVNLDSRYRPGTSLPPDVHEPLVRFMVLTGTSPVDPALAGAVAYDKGVRHPVRDVSFSPAEFYRRQLTFFRALLTERLPRIAPALELMDIDVDRDLLSRFQDGTWTPDGFPLGLQHRDLHGTNVLVGGGVHIIDPETAAFGHGLYDLAYFAACSPRPEPDETAMLRHALATAQRVLPVDETAAIVNYGRLSRMLAVNTISQVLSRCQASAGSPRTMRRVLERAGIACLDRAFAVLFPERDRAAMPERVLRVVDQLWGGDGQEPDRPGSARTTGGRHGRPRGPPRQATGGSFQVPATGRAGRNPGAWSPAAPAKERARAGPRPGAGRRRWRCVTPRTRSCDRASPQGIFAGTARACPSRLIG